VSAPGRQAAAAARPRAIELVRATCAALASEGVRYCHFKSNTFLDRSRTGENDLDLLVARADEVRFAAVLHGLGFKLASRPDGGLPGVLDLYGLDPDAGRVVHVHAHFQLVVGDDLTKNYRLPLEEPFLNEARPDGEFLVPPPELELILLLIRLGIKHLTWDAVATRRARIPESAHAELADLETRADQAELERLLQRWLPFVERRTLEDCRRALKPSAGKPAGVRAGRRLLADLRSCTRRRRAADVGLKFWRRATDIGARLASRPVPRKRLAAGGAVIAIVGADGAGKSTAVEEVGKRIGKTFSATTLHLGKPPLSMASWTIGNLARGRSAALKLSRLAGSQREPARATEQAVLAVLLARDRYLAFRRARRAATNGDLVICDRYPLRQLTRMDGPRVERVRNPARLRRLTDSLTAREIRYYEAITPPDVLIALLVDPETAVARTGDSPDRVRERWQEVLAVDWEAVPAHVVDASATPSDVHARIEELIWAEV